MGKAINELKEFTTQVVNEVKEEAPKAAAKFVADVKEEAPKAVEKAAKKAGEAKEEAKKAVKKAATAARKPMKEMVYLQYMGKEINKDEIVKKVKEVWTKEKKKKVSEIASLTLYLKPEENMAYYVINGEITGSVTLD